MLTNVRKVLRHRSYGKCQAPRSWVDLGRFPGAKTTRDGARGLSWALHLLLVIAVHDEHTGRGAGSTPIRIKLTRNHWLGHTVAGPSKVLCAVYSFVQSAAAYGP